jgi:hypothetical protein
VRSRRRRGRCERSSRSLEIVRSSTPLPRSAGRPALLGVTQQRCSQQLLQLPQLSELDDFMFKFPVVVSDCPSFCLADLAGGTLFRLERVHHFCSVSAGHSGRPMPHHRQRLKCVIFYRPRSPARLLSLSSLVVSMMLCPLLHGVYVHVCKIHYPRWCLTYRALTTRLCASGWCVLCAVHARCCSDDWLSLPDCQIVHRS